MELEVFQHFFKEFGRLNSLEIKIYIFLSKKGEQNARLICSELKLTKQQLYPCLKRLQNKGLIYASLERPATFYALALDKVIDMYSFTEIDKANNVRLKKNELVRQWNYMLSQNDSENPVNSPC